MIAFNYFETALPYADFLSKHGSSGDRENWDSNKSRVKLQPHELQLLSHFTRRMNILLIAGAWCGDCAFNCTILEKFAEFAPSIQIRYHDRDEKPELQEQLQINGGNRVPVAVFFSEDGHEAGRYGEKPLSEYRRKVKGIVPDSAFPAPGDRIAEAASDWLREVERVQWMLRSSPRLRRLHGD